MLKRFFYRKDNYKQLAARVERLEASVQNQAMEQTTNSASLIEPKQEESISRHVGIQVDDLTLIKGIGPKAAQKLNEAGIYNFKQLSELTDKETEALNDKISRFAGRIAREDWVGQATQFVNQ